MAKRMSDLGCAIQHTAIYKMVKADPPRRVTVDELVAFARVFDLGVEELLLPVEAVTNRHVKAAFAEWANAVSESDKAHRRVGEARASISELLKNHPETRVSVEDEMGRYVTDNYGYSEEEAVQMAMREFDPDRSMPIDAEALAAHRANRGG